jgi:diacylglycerol kinase
MVRPWRDGSAHRWCDKFGHAFRGIGRALVHERSYWVHVPMAVDVVVAAVTLHVNLIEGCLLALCVTLVLALEAVNTAIELLSREVTREQRPGLGAALDIASGAVLIGAIGAAGIGCAILGSRVWVLVFRL